MLPLDGFFNRQIRRCNPFLLFGLIVTSYRMPGMDGLELCRQLRSSERHSTTRIILVSAIAEELDKKTWQQLDLIVLPKPLDLDALKVSLSMP